ncbi:MULTISPECIES: hypothetical protein [Methylomonas]|uniref:hypothetical protein n=1 Tax=Methylomonas TaxID=416 RepID=UPI001232A4A1|nr:hypothetical protein [Methylomonas rhizoryzae]
MLPVTILSAPIAAPSPLPIAVPSSAPRGGVGDRATELAVCGGLRRAYAGLVGGISAAHFVIVAKWVEPHAIAGRAVILGPLSMVRASE